MISVNKITVVITSIVILALVTAGVLIFSQKESDHVSTPISESKQPPQTTELSETKTYTDPAGFSFEYPNNLSLSVDTDPNDQSVYSELSLHSDDEKGGIEIQVLTDKTKTADDWLIANGIDADTMQVTDLKLADLDAKQYEMKKNVTTVAVDQGTLFLITTDYQINKEFWTKVTDRIVTSFTFVQPASTAATSGGGDSTESSEEIILEGEEVIE